MRFSYVQNFQKVFANASRLHEVATNQVQALTNITKTLN